MVFFFTKKILGGKKMANFSCKLEVAKSVKTNKKTKGTKSRSHYDYIRREEKYKDKED